MQVSLFSRGIAINRYCESQLTVKANCVSQALRELSKKAVLNNRKIVVKIMYDRGSPKQVGLGGPFLTAHL